MKKGIINFMNEQYNNNQEVFFKCIDCDSNFLIYFTDICNRCNETICKTCSKKHKCLITNHCIKCDKIHDFFEKIDEETECEHDDGLKQSCFDEFKYDNKQRKINEFFNKKI